MKTDIEKLIDLAQHSRGWVFREYPPQRARLRGGCELIVIPAWLWRPRPRLQEVVRAEVIPMRRASGCQRMLAPPAGDDRRVTEASW